MEETNKSQTLSLSFTSKTRIDVDNEIIESQIMPFMVKQGQYFRTVFNLCYFNKLQDSDMKYYCSIDYLHKHNYPFGTKYAYSLFLEAKNKAKLHQEEKAFRQEEMEKRLEKKHKQQQKLIHLLKNTNNKAFYLETKTQLYWVNRKIEKLTAQLNRLVSSGVTFGTKALQRKISKMPYAHKTIGKQKWQLARNNFLYAMGRNERKYGNDCIEYFKDDNEQLNIRIELSRQLEKIEVEKKDKNKDKDRNESSQIQKLQKIIAKNKQYITVPIQSYYLLDELNHIHKKTHRVLLKKKRKKFILELHTCVEVKKDITKKDLNVGIDFNYGHLDYYLDEQCNGTIEFQMLQMHKKKENEEVEEVKDIPLSSSQRQENLRLAILALIDKIKNHLNLGKEKINFNFKIEDLNFNKKKRELFSSNNEMNKKYNYMLSNLPYSQYEKLMTIICFKQGIYLIKVNPKNTSQDALKKGWNRHIGAARIIRDK